ncbi:hybrid sensor histidine kinase/response regulator transcription factor [Pedobacter sp. Leaf194]|uniref:hybrid sensor histidine kinase/response regulator transcription factor n=1 Tax=Pedobacter sp. Leaf194 TaxID=1736297 RepID=UPI0007031408|nr:hybrid sensor histidine kinase/response regulator transcription factor [Pedobacter sp. Leaf194]KQS36778.1 hypothetical protein ASG14_06990 [Pedobacter sp. Leaf194]
MRNFLLLISICFSLTLGKAYAQSPKLYFKHFTINDGLSQNTVFCMVQDKSDFIWVGTEDGLNRFDGYDFTIYKHENRNRLSLSNSKINALLEDNAEQLWIGTADGLNVYNRSKSNFSRIKLSGGFQKELDNYITSLLQDTKNNLWVGTLGGLKLYNPKTLKTESFYLKSPYDASGLNKVRTVYQDKHGLLWVSIGNDLRCFDTAKRIFLPLPDVLEQNVTLRKGMVRIISEDSGGKYWIGTESEGLFCYDPWTAECKNFRSSEGQNYSLLSNVIRDIYFKTDNELWVGTREGLSILDTRTNNFFSYKYNRYDSRTISHNSVRHIMKDRSGNVWLGTFSGGINIYSPTNANFINIGEQLAETPGLNFPVVGAILTAPDGALWIGTEGGGLNFIDRKKGIYKTLLQEGKRYNIIKSLLKDRSGKIWLGTFDGLAQYDPDKGIFKDFKFSFPDLRTGNRQVFALAENEKGLWVGTDGKGLVLIDKLGETHVFSKKSKDENSISGNTVFSILSDNDLSLWLGTDKGLNHLSAKGKFIHYEYNPDHISGINNNAVATIFRDSRSVLWLGTKGGGINIFDQISKKFYAITEKDGLANNIVHGIREDNAGNIWVSTNKGLSKVVLRGFALPLTAKMYEIINYNISDGLQSNQFSSNAVAQEPDGELLFGGIGGITTFFPNKIIRNTYKPKVVITELLIKNKPIDLNSSDSPLKSSLETTDEILLTHEQAYISLKFAALNFINPGNNRYAYKLEGFEDDEWHYVDRQRIATYTNLDAGNYIFKVKAANNDGVWNEHVKSLKITILAPWWKTWWAYISYGLIVFLLLYFYYNYSLRNAELKNKLLLESTVREKDKEIYQRKLSFFTNISHEIKTPLTLILAPLENLLDLNTGNNRVQNQLMLMKRNGERLVRLINQLLDFRKFESGSMELHAAEGNMIRFIREVVFAFDSYARHLEIDLKIVSAKKSIRVWFDRDKFEKIMYNLLSNALKFTRPGGNIAIEIQEVLTHDQQSALEIKVIDDGIGIPEKNISKIFDQFTHYDEDGNNRYGTGIGLAFTKGLIELHHGHITVESLESKEGKNGRTCFTITLPIGKTHLKEQEMIPDYKDSENIEAYHLNTEQISQPANEIQQERKEGILLANGAEKPLMVIVEDNLDVMDFLSSHFEVNFRITKCFNGKDGVAKAIELIPDIIISDVMMPEMSGTVLCSTIKQDNRTSHIPIILLTARTPLIYKIEGLETGADDYITKPFSIKVVETRVWNLLESRRLLRERYRKEITLQPTNIAITSPDEVFLDKVMNFIEKNMAETTLNVEELGKEVFMSRVTLYRKIKALTNQTTIEFIRMVRLKKASQFLETGQYGISEVGYLVGFTDIDYFRKCFKEQFNQTPSEFIKKTSANKK